MGHKILDVKADIHEDPRSILEKYFQMGLSKAIQSRATQAWIQFNGEGVQEDILDIVDKHFEKIER